MATGKSVQDFDISDVSEGCNYSDDIRALTKKQSPDSMNVEFYNGRIRKRKGETAFTTAPTGQGGIDSYTKLMLHADGTNASTTFTDSETTPKSVTAAGNAQISTAISKFGGGAGLFGGAGIDSSTVLMLHCDGINGGTTFTDSASGAKTVTPNGDVNTSTAQKKFGTAAALFDGAGDYLSLADSDDWNFGTGDFTIDLWANFSSLSSSGRLYNQQPDGSIAIYLDRTTTELNFTVYNGGVLVSLTTSGLGLTTGTWYHVAVVRNGTSWNLYVNGVSKASATASITVPDITSPLQIGARVYAADSYFSGYLDEFRVSKGTARWTANFTPPALSYTTGDYLSVADSSDWNYSTGDFTIDFWIYPTALAGLQAVYSQDDNVGTNQVIFFLNNTGYQFSVASGGIQIALYDISSGVFSVGIWQHVAIVRYGSTLTIYVNGAATSPTVTNALGATAIPDVAQPLEIGRRSFGSGLSYFRGYIDEYRISKGVARWTTSFTSPSLAYDSFSASIAQVGFSLIDFSDTSGNHKQIAHFGTGVYGYDKMTDTKSVLRSGAPYVRSFNAKVSSYLIQTYSDYSAPYYWDGSASSMSIVSANAPGFKRAIEYQGYMIGMNTTSNKTRCYYQSTSNLLGGGAAYTDYFTLTPAPNDDEISDPFLLNGRLYVGTKYSIFRVSFVGGVTVFEFKQVISDTGIVPGTVQTVITKEFGQVVLFLGVDKRMYLFDGANVKSISDLFYNHNAETPISLDLIDDQYKENSFSVYDFTKRIYRLFVTKKASSQNNYCMNIDVDTFAYYPFDNMKFAAGTIGYDSLLRPYLVCADRVGTLHKMFIDTNTDNGTPINEYYKSPIVSVKVQMIKQGQTIDVDVVPSSSANLLVYDKIDFDRNWKFRQALPLKSSRDKVLGQSFVLGSSLLGSTKDILASGIAINASFNTYRFMLYSDTPTAVAWEIYDIIVNQDILSLGLAEPQL